jgi:hypothetical protein
VSTPTKADVRIIDFVDTGHPALLRMWDKRQRGYRAMGYSVLPQAASMPPREATALGEIEIELPRARIQVRGAVDLAVLERVLASLAR